jgi:hypothetical protein
MEADMNSTDQLNVAQGIPPSFGGNELGYLFALFGLLMVALLALNWLWRLGWCMLKEDVHPIRSPVTIARVVIVCLLLSSLMRGAPDAVLLLQWPELSTAAKLRTVGVRWNM